MLPSTPARAQAYSPTMPFFVAFRPEQASTNSGFSGVGNTPYANLAEAIEAAMISNMAAREDHGIEQRHSVVEAPTSQDALLFASGVRPPPHVLENMFGDPAHVITGCVVWMEGEAE